MIIHTDCIRWLQDNKVRFDTVFMDPPDNIGLGYEGVSDRMGCHEYYDFLYEVIRLSLLRGRAVWVSFNSKHTIPMGVVAKDVIHWFDSGIEVVPCVQTFTFGQSQKKRMGNGHRPLWLFQRHNAEVFPDRIKVKSWRQENGDKRAAPGGKVPLDVFEFARVTGNSRQRRSWHPTQLNEGLVERCLKYTTPDGGTVLDPFAGTGTTLRVAKRLGFQATCLDLSRFYCDKIAEEHGLEVKECVIEGEAV